MQLADQKPRAPRCLRLITVPAWTSSPTRLHSLSSVTFLGVRGGWEGAAECPPKAIVIGTSAQRVALVHTCVPLSLEIFTVGSAGSSLDAVVWGGKRERTKLCYEAKSLFFSHQPASLWPALWRDQNPLGEGSHGLRGSSFVHHSAGFTEPLLCFLPP